MAPGEVAFNLPPVVSLQPLETSQGQALGSLLSPEFLNLEDTSYKMIHGSQK